MVKSATEYNYTPGSGGNAHLDVAAGGILVCGLAYGAFGLIVMFFGHNWIEMIMPPGNIYFPFITSFHFITFNSSGYWNGCSDYWHKFVFVGL